VTAPPGPGSRQASAFAGAPAWIWPLLLLGLALRAWLVLSTEGTSDVPIWVQHARGVHEHGLAEYYVRGYKFNHPPATGIVLSWLWALAAEVGLPFRVLLRAPFALLDLATAALLVPLLRDDPRRFGVAALYWLCPLSILLSAYHGNTDSALAFFGLAATLCVARGRAALAGVALGLGVGVKLPLVIAAAPLFFALPTARERGRIVAAAALTALLVYLPGLVLAPRSVVENVLLYGGQNIQSTAGVRIWGIQNFYHLLYALPRGLHGVIDAATGAYYAVNTPVCLGLGVAWAWLRRRERGPRALAITVGGAYVIFYGFTNYWAFQYLAWSLPFLVCFDLRLAVPALALLSGYVYAVYAWVCEDPLLRGTWDFAGHPQWPAGLLVLRDLGNWMLFVLALVLLAGAARREWRWRRGGAP